MSAGRIRLVAGASQVYEGRRLRAGDIFDATLTDAADLAAVGFASPAPDVPAQPDMAPDLPPDDCALLKKPRKKREYKRRDMESET